MAQAHLVFGKVILKQFIAIEKGDNSGEAFWYRIAYSRVSKFKHSLFFFIINSTKYPQHIIFNVPQYY